MATKIKNTLSDLNNILFEAIERINDESIDGEKLSDEIKRCGAISSLGNAIIKNAELQLNAIKHADEYGYTTAEKKLPRMLE